MMLRTSTFAPPSCPAIDPQKFSAATTCSFPEPASGEPAEPQPASRIAPMASNAATDAMIAAARGRGRAVMHQCLIERELTLSAWSKNRARQDIIRLSLIIAAWSNCRLVDVPRERERSATVCGMCVGCAMMAASAATGFRSWLQTHRMGWLTPRRMRALTIAAMCAAGLVSTVGISGSTPPASHHATLTDTTP